MGLLKDIHETHRQKSLFRHVRYTLYKLGKSALMPSEVSSFGVSACVDYGKWIVKCPFCAGAEPVDFDDLRFFCLSCFNEEAQGKWLWVSAPNEAYRTALEEELSALPSLPFNAHLRWEAPWHTQ